MIKQKVLQADVIYENKQGLLLFRLMQIFTFTTLIQTFFPFSINRVIGALIIICVIYYSFYHLNRRTIILLLLLSLFLFLNVVISFDKETAIVDTIYFSITVLMLNLFCNAPFYNSFSSLPEKTKSTGNILLVLCNLVLLIGIFDVNTYLSPGGGWGSGEFFRGYSEAPHTLASACCLILVFVFIRVKNSSLSFINIFYLAIPIYAIFMSGARAFLISPLIIIWYIYRMTITNKALKNLFISTAIFTFVFVLLGSATYIKNNYLFTIGQQSGEFLDIISNSRITLWRSSLIEFAYGNLYEILFGRGFDYIYRFLYSVTRSAVWAHNDIINLLISTGVIGVFLYTSVLIAFIKKTVKNTEKLPKIMFIVYILFPLMFNGFYMYQHYFFSAILLSSVIKKDIIDENTICVTK